MKRRQDRVKCLEMKTRDACIRIAVILLTGALTLGCSHEENGKASHFEHDHEVAEHWPSDLGDLADKLRSRLPDPSDAEVRHEIEDLVSWVGEVAADTDLSERDWLPLYERSEAISKALKRSEENWSSELTGEIESLCALIDDSAAKLESEANEPGANPS